MQQLMVAYNDLVDLNQETEELLKSVEIVRGEYISHSKSFMNTARYVKLKKGSVNKIEIWIERLNHSNEVN